MKTKKIYEQPQAEVINVEIGCIMNLVSGEQENVPVNNPNTEVDAGDALSKGRGDDFDWDLGF